MKVKKRFKLIEVRSNKVDRTHILELVGSHESGPYYDIETSKTDFDTEDEAIKYAYEQDKWAEWLIVPVITFDNH